MLSRSPNKRLRQAHEQRFRLPDDLTPRDTDDTKAASRQICIAPAVALECRT
jgi:hypothetical protein